MEIPQPVVMGVWERRAGVAAEARVVGGGKEGRGACWAGEAGEEL